jgi:membrane-associated phospholipid phosphatase
MELISSIGNVWINGFLVIWFLLHKDKVYGLRCMAFYFTMLWVNGVSKISMHNPRPDEVLNEFDGWNEQHSLEDRAIQGRENWYWRYDSKWPCSHSSGMPSGHTASTAYVVWHLAWYFTFKDSSANQSRSCLKKIFIWIFAMVVAI